MPPEWPEQGTELLGQGPAALRGKALTNVLAALGDDGKIVSTGVHERTPDPAEPIDVDVDEEDTQESPVTKRSS